MNNSSNQNSTTKPTSGKIDIFDDSVKFKSAEKFYINELVIFEKTYEILKDKNISSTTKLPISIDELESEVVNKVIENEKERDGRRRIPENLVSLFIGSTAEKEINAIILESYDEFVEFLNSKNVSQQYIENFESNTLPKNSNRIRYNADNTTPYPAITEKFDGVDLDYSQLMITFQARHFYNYFNAIKSSGIYNKNDSDKFYRNLAVRFLSYHEFNHGLQRAYANIKLPERDKQSKSYTNQLVTDDVSLMNADDSKWKFSWGPDYLNDLTNQIVSEERQADSVAFENLIWTYKMSDTQQKLLREFLFERLADGRNIVNRVLPAFSKLNKDLDLTLVGSTLVDSFVRPISDRAERTALSSVVFRLDGLASYAGYFNQMNDAELNKLFELLK
jgi:hypothetical protein